MTFLTPGLIYGLSLLAVPILIHLWQRKKVVQMPFSTLRFLKIVAARTSRSSKIENLLLLLLRCLIVALVAMAAARPVVSTEASKLFGGNVPRSIALIIDHSMSMGYKSGEETRLQLAQHQAQAVIDDLKPGDEVAVFAVSDRARPVIPEPAVDHDAVRKAVESVQQTEARTDFSAALREARKAIGKSARGAKQIFLFTDAQESGWQFDKSTVFDDTWRQTNPRLIVVRPDELSPVNGAVSRVHFDTPFAAAGGVVRGTVTVQNQSAALLNDVLEIRAGTEKIAAKPIEIAPGSSVEVPVEFTTPSLPGRWMLGTASISGDNLPADDRFYFTLPLYQPPRVLIVESSSGPEKARPAFFLRKALMAGAAGAPIKTIAPAELDESALEPFSAVFLADVPEISDRASVRLDRYLQAGGTVVVMPGDQTDLENLAKQEWMPAKPTQVKELPAGRLVARAIEPQHPLFTNSWDANTPFPALPQRKMLEFASGGSGRVLLTLGDGLPFIIYGDRGSGRVIIVNASPDRAWGDFPLTAAFLPLVQQIGRLSIARTGKEAAWHVGDQVPMLPSLPKDGLTIKVPHGEVEPIAAGAPLLERAEQAGFYEVSSAAEGLVHQFAVNVDPRESDLTPIADAALTRIIAHDNVAGTDALRLWLARSRGLVPLWPLLLALALAAFVGEGIYANYLAGKRAQGDEAQIKTGRLNRRRAGQPFREGASAEPSTAEAQP
ncbi:MAG TPA: BatA and WFA domain-containing protein [Chthoniobacter sp.]|jgi:hypothetical protein